MPRRGSSGVQALVLVAVLLLFIYGYYSYNELKSVLKKSEEAVKRFKLQEENASTQLRVLNEEKNQLEESMKQEKENFNKEKLANMRMKTELEKKFSDDKTKLADQITLLSEELRKIKEGYEALQAQQQKHEELDKEHANERAKLTVENKLLKQDAINKVAVLNDQIADLKRKNDVLRSQSKRDQQQPKQNDNGQQLQNAPEGNALPNNNQQAIGSVNDNRIRHLDHDNKPNVEGRVEENHQEVQMQINGPMEKKQAYFEPREAKPDHPVVAKPVRVLPIGGEAHENLPHADQVVPPVLEHADDLNRKESPDAAVADDEEKPHVMRRGVKARQNGIAGNHQFNSVNNPEARPEKVDQHQQSVHRGIMGLADKARAANVGFRVNDMANAGDHQIEKPEQQIREHRLNNLEENQLQGPAPHNEQNANDRDDAADADEDEDYRYEDNKNKAPEKDAADGPHAAPVDEDDENKDGGL